jgi:hypothetical protein
MKDLPKKSNMITMEDLKDFDFTNDSKVEFVTKPGFVEKRIQQMIQIGANEEYEKYSEGMSDDDIAKWKEGFVVGANWLLKNKNEKNI